MVGKQHPWTEETRHQYSKARWDRMCLFLNLLYLYYTGPISDSVKAWRVKEVPAPVTVVYQISMKPGWAGNA